jgi:hypothetical protein
MSQPVGSWRRRRNCAEAIREVVVEEIQSLEPQRQDREVPVVLTPR